MRFFIGLNYETIIKQSLNNPFPIKWIKKNTNNICIRLTLNWTI